MPDTNTHPELESLEYTIVLSAVSPDLQCNKCHALYPSIVNHMCVVYTQAELDKAVREARIDEIGQVVLELGNQSVVTNRDGKFITVQQRYDELTQGRSK